MSKYFRAGDEVRSYVDELVREYHDHLLTAKFGLLFQEKAPKSKNKLQLASVCLFPAKFQAFFPEDEYDYLLTVSADVWNRAWPEQKRALIDHELCHCWGEEDEETGEMVWSVVGHDCEAFNAELIRHGAWHKDLELARKAFLLARPMGSLPDLTWQAPASKKVKILPQSDHRQLDLEEEIAKADPKRMQALEVTEKLLRTLSESSFQEALALIRAWYEKSLDKPRGLDLFEAGEKAGLNRPRVLAEIDRLREELAREQSAEPATAAAPSTASESSAPSPLDVDCARCGVVAGEPCRSLERGKKRGQPLAEGVYHDERIAALAPAGWDEDEGEDLDQVEGEEVG